MNVNKISGLSYQEYEHPFDKSARNTLEQTPGLEFLVKKLNYYGIEKILKIQYTGSNLKVNSQNFSDIYDILKKVCDVLCLAEVPELYIQWGYSINAFTAGVEKPIIVLNSGCIDLLSPEELMFVIGHEIGHIKSKHVLYYQMASVMPGLSHIIGEATFGLGGLVATGLQLALLNWRRMSEFTADRAGLLACQDVNCAANALIKMAGLPHKFFNTVGVESFITQAKEFEGYDYQTLDKVAKVMSTMWQEHPWTVMRASELFKWVETGAYHRVLQKRDWRQQRLREVPIS
ncbi:M48 family metallopeptidase [Gloeocapsopsis dulcis]|uniref:Protease n=1 Tax=Gloeocapsopsis dulcis AAB1 = 1H9 TaxID=1433147 RepID=A0A6N8FRR5_9CHRO|nr:M48 family metallopeptidase [Gloeocapsopsis dulcis]MUL35025.1 protease [Gloeocapsopsis dulcis AAB1 = 1H9]WNN89898.1 M48 family metallopeptidase [Gloeocapsopsis dulcis]